VADDIVTRLRGLACPECGLPSTHNQFDEAADEIENLREAIEGIANVARVHYPSGILWGAINHALSVADKHYKNCDCGERYA
jgi:hypothetical protein